MNVQLVGDPWFWAVAIPAVALTGISKGGLGGGAGGISTPLLAMVISPVQGAAIMLPILCVMDIAGIRAYLGGWDRRIMKIILAGGLIGSALGMLTFRMLDDNWIRLLLGVISLGFLTVRLWPRASAPQKGRDRAGYFWSALSGYTSFVSHSGSPPLLVYLLPQRLDKAVFAATCIIYFAVMNYVKIVPYLWMGLLDLRNLATSVALIPVGVAGVYGGMWLQRRVSTRFFYRFLYAVLLITGSKLLFDGVSGLLR